MESASPEAAAREHHSLIWKKKNKEILNKIKESIVQSVKSKWSLCRIMFPVRVLELILLLHLHAHYKSSPSQNNTFFLDKYVFICFLKSLKKMTWPLIFRRSWFLPLYNISNVIIVNLKGHESLLNPTKTLTCMWFQTTYGCSEKARFNMICAVVQNNKAEEEKKKSDWSHVLPVNVCSKPVSGVMLLSHMCSQVAAQCSGGGCGGAVDACALEEKVLLCYPWCGE